MNFKSAVEEQIPQVSRWTRYHRHLEHGDFSLEANTEAAPEAGHFYLLRHGRVLLKSEDFLIARAAYGELCGAYWAIQLTSTDPARRLASAWGLVGLDSHHQAAALVIAQDGTPADQKRLGRARSYERFQGRARRKAAAAAAATEERRCP